MRLPNLEFQSRFEAVALALTLVTLWLLMRGYHGLTGDGQIYAFQAFARLHPQLASDLYLQNSSQDRFTLFSPMYAWCVGLLGLEIAARLLTLLFTLWFLAAVWSFTRPMAGRYAAWAAVAFLLIIPGNYGGSDVFHLLDPSLTARLPAEALIVTALACQVRGMPWLSMLIGAVSLLIHPLMALPGLLLLVCMWLPLRAGVLGAIGGVFAVLAASIVAVYLPAASSYVLTIMDAPWLDVVRERSQFLFLHLWSMHDWDVNAQPFVSLGFTAIAITDERTRRLCATAALVGAAGLAVSSIGDLVGPVAIFVQGQAWRWVWLTVLVGAVLLPATAAQAGRDKTCGPLCALLLVSSWILPGIHGTACAGAASILWLSRTRISCSVAKYLRCASGAFGIAILVWVWIKCWAIISPSVIASAAKTPSVAQMQDVLALKIPAVLLVTLIGLGIRSSRTAWGPLLLSAMLGIFSAVILPASFSQSRRLGSSTDIDEFADWAAVIPPTSTVFVAPSRDVGAFVWFTLERPNYLSLDQSAGVIFSRATALEVRRRSEVLLPLTDPDWRIFSRLRLRADTGYRNQTVTRPLTRSSLIQVCADLRLGFVISPEVVGFDPSSHTHPGTWRNWNLYDCRRVRSMQSAI